MVQKKIENMTTNVTISIENMKNCTITRLKKKLQE